MPEATETGNITDTEVQYVAWFDTVDTPTINVTRQLNDGSGGGVSVFGDTLPACSSEAQADLRLDSLGWRRTQDWEAYGTGSCAPVERATECRWGQENDYVDCGGPSETVQGVRLCDAHADAVESTGFPAWATWAPTTTDPTT